MKKSKLILPEYITRNLDKYKYVLLVCCVGLGIALWPSAPQAPKQQEKTTLQEAQGAETAALEQELSQLLSQMHGVGRAQVFLTAKRGYATNYIYNTNQRDNGGEGQVSTEDQRELVIISQSGGESPVVGSVDSPEYQGALVLCDGADSPKVQLELTQALKSLTGITADNITIAKLK